MNHIVTVDDAIKKGKMMVFYPGVIILVGTMALGFYLGIKEILAFWIIPSSIPFSIFLAWLYWSFMLTKWKLWAFEHVRNVHELQKRATAAQLIYPNGYGYLRMSEKNKEKWRVLEKKFAIADVFQDDLNVPEKTIICISKTMVLLEMGFMLLPFLGGGIYFLLQTKNYLIGSGMSIIGLYFGFKGIRKSLNNTPQIIISEEGIQTVTTSFYKWNEIRKDKVVTENAGKNNYNYLIYNHPNGYERIQIDELETDIPTLSKLLILYRGRSKNKINFR